jgi:aconitase A
MSATNHEQIHEAIRVMERARADVDHVIAGLQAIGCDSTREVMPFIIMNTDDPHQVFEVVACDPGTAALAALGQLGWAVDGTQQDEEEE